MTCGNPLEVLEMENWVEWEFKKQNGVVGPGMSQNFSLKKESDKGKLSQPAWNNSSACYERSSMQHSQQHLMGTWW
jgi:hypothetical protein